MACKRSRNDPTVRKLHGWNLKHLRIDVGLSQGGLAERIGWRTSDVSNLETGIRDAASIKVTIAIRIAGALGVDVGEYARRVMGMRPWPTDPLGDGDVSIRARRKALGLSVEQAAKASGVGVRSLYQWEKEPRAVMVAELRRAVGLAHTLRLSMSDLLGLAGGVG